MALIGYTITVVAKQDNPYNVLPETDISIRKNSDNTLVNIYADEAGLIPIAQLGAKTDSNGQFTFYADASLGVLKAVWTNGGVIATEVLDKSDHSRLVNRNAVGAHDAIYARNFKTVADLKAGIDADGNGIDMTQIVGSKVFWRGYYSESDGGSNWGIVKSGTHTDDGFTIFSIDATTYVESNQTGYSVNFKKGGAKGDDLFVNDSAFETVLSYANANKIPVAKLTSGLFRTNTTTLIPAGVTIKGYNQSGVKFLTTSGVYFSQVRYYGDGPCFLSSNSGVNAITSYSASAIDGLQIRYFGTTQATSYGVQVGTIAKESLQFVVKNTLIQNFGRGIYNVGSWNVQLTDVYIYSTTNPTPSASPLTFGVYVDAQTRAITSNYFTRVFVQSCDTGFYVQGTASYSGMTDVYTDACNVGYHFNGAGVSAGRGWAVKGLGLEAPKYKGLIVEGITLDVFGFSFVKGTSTTYERILEVRSAGSCNITGGDDIPSGSYGTVDGMNVDETSDLSIRDLACSPQNMIKGSGAVRIDINGQKAHGGLITYPPLVETIGFANRNNQRSKYKSYVWTPDGATQSVPTTTGLTTKTFDVSLVDDYEIITVTNNAAVGSGHNINLKDNALSGFENCGIVRHYSDTSGIIILPSDCVRLLKKPDGLLYRIKEI